MIIKIKKYIVYKMINHTIIVQKNKHIKVIIYYINILDGKLTAIVKNRGKEKYYKNISSPIFNKINVEIIEEGDNELTVKLTNADKK